MSDEFNDPIENKEGNEFFESPTKENAQVENGEGKSPPESVTEEDLLKQIKDEHIANTIAELLRGQKVASVYIDARQHYETRVGSVAGAVSSGSGDVKYGTASTGKRSEGSVDTGQVLSEDLEKIKNVYVRPSPYNQAQKLLSERHVVLLLGSAHSGKLTTALHLLSSFNDGIFEISPNIKPEKLGSFEFEKEQGYVIDTLVPDEITSLNSSLLNRLSNKLVNQNSYLVITVDSRVALSRESLSRYLVVWNDIPNRDDLLKQYLAWYSTDNAECSKAEELSKSDAVQQLLNTHLLPREIDHLAILLTKVAKGELDLQAALSRFEAQAYRDVETWFDNNKDLENRAFMVSVAVLNGASYQAIADAAKMLQSSIEPLLPEDELQVTNTIFGKTHSQRLKEVCAHPVQGYEQTHFGRSPVELVELDNPTFQPAVLRYIWKEFDGLRELLLVWLRDLGSNSGFDVRVRSAAAVGELSKYNFKYVESLVLSHWAKQRDNKSRASAALALGIPAWEGEFAPQVLGLLHHWSTLRHSQLCRTATEAYGGLVGQRFPDIALHNLHLIARNNGIYLLDILSRSVASLFEVGYLIPDYYFKVIDTLIIWTADRKDQTATTTGLLIFLTLAFVAKVEAPPDGGKWPTFLWLAQENEDYKSKITRLLRRTLNTDLTEDMALDILHYWLLIVEEDTRLYSLLSQLIVTLAKGTINERRRLNFFLTRWSQNPEQESKAAKKILAILDSD